MTNGVDTFAINQALNYPRALLVAISTKVLPFGASEQKNGSTEHFCSILNALHHIKTEKIQSTLQRKELQTHLKEKLHETRPTERDGHRAQGPVEPSSVTSKATSLQI